jgi:hypothetical protein
MEASEFRNLFCSFAGPDRYRQFVRALNVGGRWRGRFQYWQERLIAGFLASFPSAEVGFERVEALLRVCELHGADLAHDPDGLSSRCRGAITEYTLAGADRFPNCDCGPVVMGRRFDNSRRGLWYCPVCRLAEAEYVATQGAFGGVPLWKARP